jgi:hypothetical protein
LVLDIEVQSELVEPDRIDLLFALVVEPGLDHVLGKDIPAQQKIMILPACRAPNPKSPAWTLPWPPAPGPKNAVTVRSVDKFQIDNFGY